MKRFFDLTIRGPQPNRILTFDRHFRNLTTPRGEPFVLLPDDA